MINTLKISKMKTYKIQIQTSASKFETKKIIASSKKEAMKEASESGLIISVN